MRILSVLLLAFATSQPPEWQASDQFDRPHHSSELAGRPVLVIAGGSPAAKTFDAWIDAIVQAYGGRPDSLPFAVLGIADVGNPPGVILPIIRRTLPRSRQRPVLVDRRGTVSRHYGTDSQTSNQLVVGHDGTVLLHLKGIPVDTAKVRELVHRLHAAVDAAAAARRSR
jgi:hypothetical protein